LANETVTFKEAVAQLVKIGKCDIDLLGVLSTITPEQAHWRTEADLLDDFDQPGNHFSRGAAEKYLTEKGIPSRVIAYSLEDFTSGNGVIIMPSADRQLWNPNVGIQTFKEIDFSARFEVPGGKRYFTENALSSSCYYFKYNPNWRCKV
jgi:hypothetical protein